MLALLTGASGTEDPISKKVPKRSAENTTPGNTTPLTTKEEMKGLDTIMRALSATKSSKKSASKSGGHAVTNAAKQVLVSKQASLADDKPAEAMESATALMRRPTKDDRCSLCSKPGHFAQTCKLSVGAAERTTSASGSRDQKSSHKKPEHRADEEHTSEARSGNSERMRGSERESGSKESKLPKAAEGGMQNIVLDGEPHAPKVPSDAKRAKKRKSPKEDHVDDVGQTVASSNNQRKRIKSGDAPARSELDADAAATDSADDAASPSHAQPRKGKANRSRAEADLDAEAVESAPEAAAKPKAPLTGEKFGSLPLRDGDWACATCGNCNFSWRDKVRFAPGPPTCLASHRSFRHSRRHSGIALSGALYTVQSMPLCKVGAEARRSEASRHQAIVRIAGMCHTHGTHSHSKHAAVVSAMSEGGTRERQRGRRGTLLASQLLAMHRNL